MKHTYFYTIGLIALLLSSAAYAQAVEAVPLSAPSYTLNKETDPMAMDPAGASPDKTINRGETAIAPLPPGADDQAGTSTHDVETPSPTTPSPDFSPSDNTPTPPAANVAPSASYPNNSVSGVLPVDESKFENRVFCTLKVAFNSKAKKIDTKTADKIKTYLDTNADKLTYKRGGTGKNGEFEYCIDIPQHNQRSKVYAGLKRLLPSKDTADTRTVLTGKGFTRVQHSQ